MTSQLLEKRYILQAQMEKLATSKQKTEEDGSSGTKETKKQKILNQILSPYSGQQYWENKLKKESEELLQTKDAIFQQETPMNFFSIQDIFEEEGDDFGYMESGQANDQALPNGTQGPDGFLKKQDALFQFPETGPEGPDGGQGENQKFRQFKEYVF